MRAANSTSPLGKKSTPLSRRFQTIDLSWDKWRGLLGDYRTRLLTLSGARPTPPGFVRVCYEEVLV